MKTFARWITFTLITTILVFLPSAVHSQNEKDNIDVVIIMDSSGSMKKTDPQFLRKPAAKLFISLLDKGDRAAIMSFSDQGYPISYFTPVDGKTNKERLFRSIDKISSRGLYTNLHDAFKKGLGILRRDGREDSKKIIVLMSDGMMDVGSPEQDSALVDQLRTDVVSDFKDNDIKVFAIAFTKQSDMKLLKEISEHTGGLYNLALSDKDFHIVFTGIFESLKSPDMLPMESNRFQIDSSISEVTIVATKGSPDTRIQLNSPDGKQYAANKKYSGIGWFESETFDMITVQKPAEGEWEILFSTGKNNKAYIITDLKLQTNFDHSNKNLGDPFDLKFWLEKNGSKITEPEILNKIELSVMLTNPDENITKLKPFNAGEGIYQSIINPLTPGNHSIKIVAKGMTFEREKSIVFSVINTAGEQQINDTVPEEVSEHEVTTSAADEEIKEEVLTKEVSWTKFIVIFVVINIVIGSAALMFIKRRSLKSGGLSELFRKRRGDEADEEDSDAQVIETEPSEAALAEKTSVNEEEPAGDVIQSENSSPEKPEDNESQPDDSQTGEKTAEDTQEGKKNQIELAEIEKTLASQEESAQVKKDDETADSSPIVKETATDTASTKEGAKSRGKDLTAEDSGMDTKGIEETANMANDQAVNEESFSSPGENADEESASTADMKSEETVSKDSEHIKAEMEHSTDEQNESSDILDMDEVNALMENNTAEHKNTDAKSKGEPESA